MDIVLEDPDSLLEIGEGWQHKRRCCNLATASFSSDNDTNSEGFQYLAATGIGDCFIYRQLQRSVYGS
jgi:hypothetical protein